MLYTAVSQSKPNPFGAVWYGGFGKMNLKKIVKRTPRIEKSIPGFQIRAIACPKIKPMIMDFVKLRERVGLER